MHRVKRLITNGCKDARYLISSGWRFVLSDDGMTVLTVERVKRSRTEALGRAPGQGQPQPQIPG